jgi:SAM-dependent methyltransferase
MYRVNDVARELVANFAMGIPAVRTLRVSRGRTVGASIATKARSVVAQFEFFMDTIGREDLRGKTVVEIGPGDAIPLALLFIGAGADRYVAIDRFLGDVFGEDAMTLYREVLALTAPEVRAGLQARGFGTSAGDLVTLFRSRHVALIREGIEREVPQDAREADFIVSFNVCEHLADLGRALRNMAALLSPDGRMIHRIDYGPHDLWQSYGNPLAFLTVPGRLWNMMSSNRGCPNRVRHREFLGMAGALGLSSLDRPGRCASLAEVREIKPRLAARFGQLSDEDLRILDAEIVLGFKPDLRLGRAYVDESHVSD